MALGAVIHQFAVQLSHVDRGVYEALDLRVARHPSESEEYLCARVLAYALEYREGLAFTKGLADPDQPAIEERDLTGALRAWIDIGTPDAARLHRASKAAPRVAVYTHQDARRWWDSLAEARIHRAQDLELFALDRALVATLVGALERRNTLELTVSDGTLYLSTGGAVHEAALARHRLA